MPRSDWTDFVKKWAKDRGVPYACALTEAKVPYQEWKKKREMRGGAMLGRERMEESRRDRIRTVVKLLDHEALNFPNALSNHRDVDLANQILQEILPAMPEELPEVLDLVNSLPNSFFSDITEVNMRRVDRIILRLKRLIGSYGLMQLRRGEQG